VLWACVRLPQLALDGVLRQHPSPELPLVLLSGPPQRRRLFDANPAARAAGLFPGQALAGAQVLLTQFAAIDHDPAQESRLLDLLCAWAYRYSGMVARLGTPTRTHWLIRLGHAPLDHLRRHYCLEGGLPLSPVSSRPEPPLQSRHC